MTSLTLCILQWENHSNSLKLEVEEKEEIKCKIEGKVLAMQGTWIDWQYLLNATELLQRCRYTLQYTYPYAYYLQESDCRKQLVSQCLISLNGLSSLSLGRRPIVVLL